jgi:hypothetical protein
MSTRGVSRRQKVRDGKTTVRAAPPSHPEPYRGGWWGDNGESGLAVVVKTGAEDLTKDRYLKAAKGDGS